MHNCNERPGGHFFALQKKTAQFTAYRNYYEIIKEINDCLTNLKDLNTDKPDTLDKPNSTRERATMIKSKIFQPSRK